MALATLDAQQSRRAALAILVAVIVGIVAPIAFGVWSVNRYYDRELREKRERIERYQRIASMRPDIVKQLDAMRAKDPRKFFLRSGAVALSAAEAQEAVRSIVEANGGKLVTMQAPSSREDGRYRQITVNVQLTANIQALRRILHAIETNTPYLFVDNLMVRSQVSGQHRPGPGQEPEMFVHFDVSGYAPAST
ncbi:MAG TPA: type II secretion system protein GspM [Usitatibacter sp.]|nr:type II secretion system protein GspM [Usitatibacter sp.]